MISLPFRLERFLLLRARPDVAFSVFTSPAHWAAWWGQGSTVDTVRGTHADPSPRTVSKAHIAAVHKFMPGLRLERRGEIRHCQWQVLADWVALSPDGRERARDEFLRARRRWADCRVHRVLVLTR